MWQAFSSARSYSLPSRQRRLGRYPTMENREIITIICGQTLEFRIKYLCGDQTGCKITVILRLAFLIPSRKSLRSRIGSSGSMIAEGWQSNPRKAGIWRKKVELYMKSTKKLSNCYYLTVVRQPRCRWVSYCNRLDCCSAAPWAFLLYGKTA